MNSFSSIKLVILLVFLLLLSGCTSLPQWFPEAETAADIAKSAFSSSLDDLQEPENAVISTADTALEAPASEAAAPATVHVHVDENASGQTNSSSKLRIIFTGDSRMVCVYCSQAYSAEEFPSHIFYNISETDYTGQIDSHVFVAKGGEAYSWFSRIAMQYIAPQLTDHSVIVAWFGVNDLADPQRYVNYVNNQLLSYGVPVYYLTIGPCDGSWSKNNESILAFNEALRTGLDPAVHLIDAYSFLLDGLNSGDYATLDGLHYNYDTSNALYQFLVHFITQMENGDLPDDR